MKTWNSLLGLVTSSVPCQGAVQPLTLRLLNIFPFQLSSPSFSEVMIITVFDVQALQSHFTQSWLLTQILTFAVGVEFNF